MPTLQPSTAVRNRIIILIAVLLCAAPLLIRAYQGTFTRLVADDYCTAIEVSRYGYLGAQVVTYQTWSGRYSATALQSVLVLLSPCVTSCVTSVILLLWLATLTVFWRTITRRTSTALLLAEITIGATLATMPNVAQSLLWLTGAPAYIVPLIIWPVLAHPRLHWALLAPLAFVAGGFSETSLILQMTLFAGAAVFDRRRRGRHTVVCVGTLASLAAIALAPGNTFRQAYFPPHPELRYIAQSSLQFARGTLEAFCLHSPGPVAALAGSFLVSRARAGEHHESPARLLVCLLLPASLALLIVTAAPALWAMTGFPPDRAYAPAAFALVCLFAGLGYAVGKRAKMTLGVLRLSQMVGVATVLYLVGSSVWAALGDLPSWRAFARDWARQEAAIRTGAPVPAITTPYGLGGLSPDPDQWENVCMSLYYGVPGLRTSEP